MTIARAEAGSDERAAIRRVPVRTPVRALMALRAAHAVVLSVDDEVRHLARLGSPPLPAVIGPRRADEVDPVPGVGRPQCSALTYAASIRCSDGASSASDRASWIALVCAASCTLAGADDQLYTAVRSSL